MKIIPLLLAMIGLLSAADSQAGEMYKYRDARGYITYSDIRLPSHLYKSLQPSSYALKFNALMAAQRASRSANGPSAKTDGEKPVKTAAQTGASPLVPLSASSGTREINLSSPKTAALTSAPPLTPLSAMKGIEETSLPSPTAKAHPRSVNLSSLRIPSNAIGELQADMLRIAAKPLFKPPLFGTPPIEVQRMAFSEEADILIAALTWLKTGNTNALAEARRRTLNLAALPTNGTASYRAHDQAGRALTWAMALSYDWLYDRWTPAERQMLLAVIRPRVADMLAPPTPDNPYGLDSGKKLDSWPYDSHGVLTLAKLSVICTILAGEDPLFNKCYADVVPRYLARPIPWGGDDGGYANGTTYAQWDVLYTHFAIWDMLRTALGVNLWDTPWAKSYVNYIAYFLPPGAPTGLFGDEAETNNHDVWATQAKAYATHLPSPLADWYARNQKGEQPLNFAFLQGPKRDWSGVSSNLPSGIPQAIHLASIGWVAMHSDLGDINRTSVYFKSSPYGSYNHSHADQNSFVIHAKGRALAIDSGYYDEYGSAHWLNWYKQTRAHNAITYDGGLGQKVDTMDAKGGITQFKTTPVYDITTGDATPAYGGALTRAVRTLVYLRPGTLLVHDSLASATPRTWEWNIHALNPIKVTGPKGIEFEQEGARLCVQMIDGPDVAFRLTSRFTAEPLGNRPAQWHGVFATQQKSKTASFIALLEVGCGNSQVAVTDTAGMRQVDLGPHRVLFSDSTASVVK